MKIITWNCNMAFRKKFEKILVLNPDLLVLQECENESKLKIALENENYNQILWHGNNPHKGVAVISFNTTNIEKRTNHNLEFEHIFPLKMTIKDKEVNLFCIWAMPHKSDRKKHYVGQIWGAIQYYTNNLNQDSILIGDFNSNTIWDKKNRIGNHSDVVSFLKNKNIHSVYHKQMKCKHGEELHPTLFLLKNKAKPYHLDFCFAPNKFISEETKITIGSHDEWIKLSDHMPIIIENLNL